MSEGEVTFRGGPGWQPACLPAGPAGGVRPRGAGRTPHLAGPKDPLPRIMA